MIEPYKLKRSVYKRGKYYWVKWYQNGKARYQSTKMTNRELALEEADKIVISFLKEKGIITTDIMLSELIEKFDEDLQEQVRNKSIAKNTYFFYKAFCDHIKRELGHFYLSQLTVEDIQQYLKKRREKKNLSVTTMRDEHLTWNKLLKFAVKRGLCKENIMEQITKPKKNLNKIVCQKPHILSEEKIKLLLDSSTPYLRDIIKLLYNTGMRRGELENLRFEDIDMERSIIFIRRHEDGWEPKGGKERTIPINKVVKEILEQKINERKDNQKYILISSSGKQAYHYHKSFQMLMKKSEIANTIPDEYSKGVHLLRHSFCSYLVNEAHVPLPIVKEIMGHEDIKTTMIYVHADEKQKQIAIKKFDFIRYFKQLRKEGKSMDETIRLIADKFQVPVGEVEDILIGNT